MHKKNRLLAKLALNNEMLENSERRIEVCSPIENDSRTESMLNFASKVEFRKNSIQGSALITALFIVTIVAIIVTSMMSKLRIDINNANLTINNDKLYLASEAATYWAILQIKQSTKPFKALDNKGKILSFPQKYHQIYPGITVAGDVYDLQARFNLNNLTDSSYKPIFYQLIGKLNPTLKKQKRLEIVEATASWINENSINQTKHDEWLDFYLKSNPSYLAGYQKMQSSSELRAVYGVNAKIYSSLIPYITALPEILPININTASKEILYSLSMDQQQDLVNKLIQSRKNKIIKNIREIEPLLNATKIDQNKLAVSSMYYLIVSQTTDSNMIRKIYTTIKISENKDKSKHIDVVKQSFNEP